MPTDPNLSAFIWSVADLLRGDYRQSEYGRVILPVTVFRRLDSVLESQTLQEQAINRRIAAFDSVVRSINTDSVYKLWHSSLSLSDPKVGQQRVKCEQGRLMYRYGAPVAMAALRRMQDTRWRDVDARQVPGLAGA